MEGRLPWHLPADLRFFKQQTMGFAVIMGRRTWESIGRPLPGRRNLVVTRSAQFKAAGARIAGSLENTLAQCAGEAKAFVIGGVELYRAALPHADCMILTEIHRDIEGDVRFPEFDRRQWKESRRQTNSTPDGLRFDFVRYEKAAA